MKRIMILITVLLAVVISGCSGAPAEPQSLKIAVLPILDALPMHVALEKGYYEEEGLDVTILPGGPDIAPPQVLAGGGADVMLNWMPSALAAREKGLPVPPWLDRPQPEIPDVRE